MLINYTCSSGWKDQTMHVQITSEMLLNFINMATCILSTRRSGSPNHQDGHAVALVLTAARLALYLGGHGHRHEHRNAYAPTRSRTPAPLPGLRTAALSLPANEPSPLLPAATPRTRPRTQP